jgi:VanZ family protein
MAMLFFFSSLSHVPSPPGILGFLTDKDEHFVFYGGLAALTVRALAKGQWRSVTLAAACGAALVSSAYGVTDEFHQRFVPGREYDVLDMAADAIGSVAAAGALWAWGIIRHRSDTPHVL